MILIKKKSYLISLLSITLIISLLLYYFEEQELSEIETIDQNPNKINSVDDYYKDIKEQYPIIHVDDIYNDQLYVDNIKNMYKELLTVNNDPFYIPPEVNETKWKDCFYSDDFFKMYTDTSCMWMWMYKLKNNWIIIIDKLQGVVNAGEEKEEIYLIDKPFSNGGFRAKLSDYKTKAYWKPCLLNTGNFESYYSEIISFLIDRILGFYHTPAVIPRSFEVDRLNLFAGQLEAKHKYNDGIILRKMESIITHCGTNKNNKIDYVEGAFIGWSPFPLKALFGHAMNNIDFQLFTDMDENDVLYWKEKIGSITSESSISERRNLIENITIQLFALITGNLNKFDHNLFIATTNTDPIEYGPFNYIDNDRAQWNFSTKLTKKLVPINPWKELCKFPQRISHRIQFFRTGNQRNMTLGSLILQLSDEIFEPNLKNNYFFSKEQAKVLDKNIDFVASMLDECLHKHPPNNVLIPETWSQAKIYNDINELFNDVLE